MNDEKKVVELVASNPEVKQQKSEIIIVAPHCDDEIIGMYSILVDKSISPVIIYTEDTPNERRQEALKLKTFLSNIKVQLFAHHVPEAFLNSNSILYFPDPIHEFHPDHRKIGYRGEELFRRGSAKTFRAYRGASRLSTCLEVRSQGLRRVPSAGLFSGYRPP